MLCAVEAAYTLFTVHDMSHNMSEWRSLEVQLKAVLMYMHESWTHVQGMGTTGRTSSCLTQPGGKMNLQAVLASTPWLCCIGKPLNLWAAMCHHRTEKPLCQSCTSSCTVCSLIVRCLTM